MFNINYQFYGSGSFKLRLRLYCDGETRYVNVTKLLKGDIKKHHWNQKKQLFVSSCPYCEENNYTLVQFRQKYEDMARNWEGSLDGFTLAIKMEDEKKTEGVTISDYIQVIINRLDKKRHADGTRKGSFENYLKLDKRMGEYCKGYKINYNNLLVSEITPAFVDGLLQWTEEKRRNKGICYISKNLHSVIMKAADDGYLNADDFKRCRWYKAPLASSQKTYTLTESQIKQFAGMDLWEYSQSRYNELYRDFCMFILYTGQSACDAIALRYCDIEKINGISHFVFKRRKIAEKQVVPCAVPISAELQAIMDKWRNLSQDGYIFPIRTLKKINDQFANNYDIKHFIASLNEWLKKIGRALRCGFPLRTYTFRHTAITRYISKGIPVVYVANMMGTSVKNCERIYYNQQGDIDSRNKVMKAMAMGI